MIQWRHSLDANSGSYMMKYVLDCIHKEYMYLSVTSRIMYLLDSHHIVEEYEMLNIVSLYQTR